MNTSDKDSIDMTTPRKKMRRPGRAILATLLACNVALLGACDTERLLEVEAPGKVPEEALNDPALAATLVASVVSDAECAWDNYVAAAAHHSDEWIPASGNLTMARWGQRRITSEFTNYFQGGCGDWGYPTYNTLHTARTQANATFERLASSQFAQVPQLAEKQAVVRLYGAFAKVALGEGFCEVALEGERVVAPAEVLRLAEQHFTEAIQFAQQAGRQDLLNAAYVGRARVRLDLGNFAGAIEDAALVPPEFRFNATRDGTTARRYNTLYEMINGVEATGMHATIAPGYRDVQWKDVADPRVTVRFTDNLAFDFVTPHWQHDKVLSRSTPVRMASWEEAQLFIAEAAARTGDLNRAIEILNAFHTRAGIPAVTAADLPTQDAVIEHIIEERRREFLSEGGHRLNDMLRFRGTQFEIPFLGEPGSDHPNGVSHTGVPYGPTTCFPLPDIEELI